MTERPIDYAMAAADPAKDVTPGSMPIAELSDDALREAYQATSEAGDPQAEGLLAEMARRGFDI